MNILQLALDLTLGGTEKTLQIFSKYLKKQNRKVIVVAFNASGPRKDFIENNGIKVYLMNNSFEKLKRLIQKEKIDIVHLHRSNDNMIPIIKYLKENTLVKIVETNVFGKNSESYVEDYVDLRVFVSMFCAMRFIKQKKLNIDTFWEKNRVLYNPLDFDEIFLWDRKKISSFKNKIGIPKDYFVIGKYGRKDNLKFGDICIEMLPYLIDKISNIKYVIIGLPNNLRKKAKKLGVYEYIIEIKPILNPKKLSLFISSMDILAHSSLIGESFGCVYTEAMAHKKPIVTNSTPYADNAQLEMVKDRINGRIANSPKDFAKAIEKLLKSKREHLRISKNNFKKAKECFDGNMLTKDLYKFYEEVLFDATYDDYLINKKNLAGFIKKKHKDLDNFKISSTYYNTKYFLFKKLEGLKRKIRNFL